MAIEGLMENSHRGMKIKMERKVLKGSNKPFTLINDLMGKPLEIFLKVVK